MILQWASRINTGGVRMCVNFRVAVKRVLGSGSLSNYHSGDHPSRMVSPSRTWRLSEGLGVASQIGWTELLAVAVALAAAPAFSETRVTRAPAPVFLPGGG